MGLSRPKNRQTGPQQRNNNWLGRTDLVTFDVFKRYYWRRLPRCGIGGSLLYSSLLLLHPHLTHHADPTVAFGDIIGTVFSGLRISASTYSHPGTIKGSEKSLESPNRALDRGAYESLTNRDYALFEAYQKVKRERCERDLADRCNSSLCRTRLTRG